MYFQNVYKYDEMKRSEHMAVRQTVGWYFFTHQLLEVTGTDAVVFLDRVMANPIANLQIGRARYTTMLNENGQILDDVVVFRMEQEKFWVSTLFVNKLIAWLDKNKGSYCVSYQDITKDLEMFAVQGPRSRDMINSLVAEPVDNQKFFSIRDNTIDGVPVKISRAGFTGEKFGYEIYIAPEHYDWLQQKLAQAAKPLDGKEVTEFQVMTMTLPAEKGFYYMRDLMYTNPLEVGLDKGIGWDKKFIGKEALLKIKEAGPARQMVGFTVEEADVHINHKCFGGPGDVVLKDGMPVGNVSKFTYSYVKDINIGYALVETGSLQFGDTVTINGYQAVITDKVFI